MRDLSKRNIYNYNRVFISYINRIDIKEFMLGICAIKIIYNYALYTGDLSFPLMGYAGLLIINTFLIRIIRYGPHIEFIFCFFA